MTRSLILREPAEHANPSAGGCEGEGVQRPQRGGRPILGDKPFHGEHRQRHDGSQQQAASGAGDHRNIPRSPGGFCCIAAYTAMGLALAAGAVGLPGLSIGFCIAVGVFALGAIWLGRL